MKFLPICLVSALLATATLQHDVKQDNKNDYGQIKRDDDKKKYDDHNDHEEIKHYDD
jgi:hypothetical protein